MAESARPSPEHTNPTVIWDAQPRQAAFIACPADDVGFGGARGGGKSDAVIGDWLSHEDIYGAAAVGMAFRRQRTELTELIERAKQVLAPIGHRWHEQDKYFRGPKGGRLRFTYLENDSDAMAYQGHGYTRLYPEEMGTFPTEVPINLLTAVLRSGHGVPCQMKSTCNPGGPGHQWVKARFDLAGRPQQTILKQFEFKNPFTGKKIQKTRVFIPSRVHDNKYLGDDYVANLYMSGSKVVVDKWLYGDWDVVEGAFFDCWSNERHVIPPGPIPEDWLRFRSMDWGSASPGSVGWWAVVGDDTEWHGRILPRGAMVRYREWYVAEHRQNEGWVGLKMPAGDIAREIKRKDNGEPIRYAVIDPAAFAVTSGPSIAEEMNVVLGRAGFHPADNKRVPQRGAMGGWDQMRARLVGDADGRPMLYVFSTCTDFIRTVPALQHDPDKPEDLDTDGEDHVADEARYACMSRPWIPSKPVVVEPKHVFEFKDGLIRSNLTIRELIDRQKKRR